MVTRPASRSTVRCCEIVGAVTSNAAAISPAGQVAVPDQAPGSRAGPATTAPRGSAARRSCGHDPVDRPWRPARFRPGRLISAPRNSSDRRENTRSSLEWPNLTPMVHAERRSLSDFLDTLAPEQWTAPTWCDKWNVQDLVAHLTAAGNITAPHFFGGLHQDRLQLRQVRRGRPAQLHGGHAGRREGALRRDHHEQPQAARARVRRARRGHGARRRHPPSARRRRATTPPSTSSTLAELYKKTGAPLRAKKRLDGLKLEATDVDWSTGDGPEVRGPVHVVDPRHGRPHRRARRLRRRRGRDAADRGYSVVTGPNRQTALPPGLETADQIGRARKPSSCKVAAARLDA